LLTVVLLGAAFTKAYRNRQKMGTWSMRILYGTTVLCAGLVVYALFYK